MAHQEHGVIKSERIAATAAAALESKAVLPALFRRESLEQFKGAKDDTINVKVEGVLPYRTYGWRNDRSTAIQFDRYAETKVAVSFGGDLYSAVELTDEQNLMDDIGWDKLATKQGDALARGLEQECVDTLLDAPYEVVVTLDRANMRESLVDLKGIFDRLRVDGSRQFVMGTNIESAIIKDKDIVLSQNTSEGIAETALREAVVGKVATFNLINGVYEMPPNEGVVMVDSAFVLITGSPTVPRSVKDGSTGSVGQSTVRWITDYDADHQIDRSILTLYKGSRHIVDTLVGKSDTPGSGIVSTKQHFVRAIKVVLGDAFSVEVDNEELSGFTGIVSTDGLNDGV